MRCGCVCLGFGFGCAPPLLAGVLGCVCACVPAPLVPAGVCGVGVCTWARVSAAPRHSWPGCWGVCVFVCALCLYQATPGLVVWCGWVCWGSGFGCAPPLLAGVLGCVCACVRAPLVPRHSWLGWCLGCLCLGSGFGCAPPLLAGVFGCVCACVRTPLVPRHSWLGCALWACVFGLGFRLRPAPPGWGVAVGVCLRARSACTPPLLAGMCGLGVCAWARVSAAPRHSWLGCWGLCVFVCALRLYPATPGWGVRCGCVCLGSGFGCAPPLLAGVLGPVCASVAAPLVPCHSWLGCAVWVCLQSLASGFGCAPPLLVGLFGPVCVCVRAPLVPRHSWLGCAVWVCVLGLGFRLRPATPGGGVGVRACLCAHSACPPSLLAGLCGVDVCAWALVSAAPRHSWLACWGVCVLVCPLRLYRLGCAVWVCVLGLGFRLRPATPGRGVGVCVCLCAHSACPPSLLAGVCGVDVCAWALVSAAPRHSWLGCWGVCVLVCPHRLYRLGCAVWMCVLGLGCRLRPATPGWGVGVCVCLCARSACTPPLLVGVCGLGVCAWARVSAAPRNSWLGCSGVRVLVCALRLYPATPGWGVRCGCVCSGSGFGCPRHSWLGYWGVCARSACTAPLLAGVCGVGVCAWARVSAAPRHSWLGCWAVCVLVCALCLYPATPGWGVRCGRVCLGSGCGCAPPFLAGVLGCVCVCVLAPLVPRHSWLGCAVWVCVLGLGFRLRPATPGWGVRRGCAFSARVLAAPRHSWLGCWGVCMCLCACSACTPPFLAGGCGVGGCAWALVSAAPRYCWLGCWGVCVRFCARSACTPPLLAGVCGVGVCAWARVSAAPHHFWLGCWGVCLLVCALCLYLVPPGGGVRCGRVCLGSCFGWPRHSWLGCWGRCVLVCALRLHPATPGWGVRCGCVCLGSGFGCAPPLLAGVLGCVCVCVRTPLVPRHSWLGCAVWVCVLVLGLRLRPATPGWGLAVGVCLCARSACTPPLLAGVCGLGVCAWARVSAAPRPSWLGCWGVCVLVCALRLYPAPPGWGVRCGRVCLGSGCGCAPPFLAGVLGCACLCARSACTPPLLAGVCGVGACAWAWVSAAPRQSWLGCWGVCVLVCALRLCPATPGWAVQCGCACLGSGFGCAPPLLAGMLGCVCVCVLAPLVPRHSWLGSAVWMHVLRLWFPLRPAIPGWGVGVCVGVCVLAPLVPRHSWLGCAVLLCVLGLGFRLRFTTPGWGVGVCVCVFVCALRLYPATPGWGVRCGCLCLGSGFGCTPPLLAAS